MITTEVSADELVAPAPEAKVGGPKVDPCQDLKVDGEQLVAKVRGLIHEGNVRRIIIKNVEGTVLIEIPLALGVVGAVLAPSLAAVGAVAAIVTDCSITVERQPASPTA